MKKLLSVLATIGLVSTSAVSVVACGTKPEKKLEESKKNITQIVKDFEQDVTKIWTEHYEKEVTENLIGVEIIEKNNEFVNKENILKFSKPENKNKLTIENKKQLANDIEKLFKIKLLEEKLNDLKKINKYKIILSEISNVFESVELVFNDNFQINSGEIVENSYIGNIIIDYKIVTHYKGLNDTEKFKLSETLKYTSTDNDSFKKVGDKMYKNIAKDMFISSETEKYVNLKWIDIKENSDDSDAYLSSNNILKEYYNENNEFHDALLSTINNKYFKQQFPSINISYNKKSIYKTDNFATQNSKYLIINNLYSNDEKNDISTFNLENQNEKEKVNKILLCDKNELNKFFLNDQFSSFKWNKVRNNYKTIQNNFLNTFLSKDEISKYQETLNYKFAVAIGYIDFIGPSIKIGKGESTYIHQLPDFKLVTSYSINGITDGNYESLATFSMKLFNIYKDIYKPNVDDLQSNDNYILDLTFKNQEIWNNVSTKSDLNEAEMNSYLSSFSSNYYKKLFSTLSNNNLEINSLINNNIFFSLKNMFYYTRNQNASFINQNKGGYFKLNSSSSSGYYLNDFRYMTFNLFGIIKFEIKFNSSIYMSNNWWIF
ncbi:lipoprotein [Spiroplasma floricola]|uniref:Lipoprotein n=1 Tax=Spiroplasma floricola 23-6 TaxID=1336749 RepID=A0A2K8SDV6_9MOLU|nr:lipoprotein [Spiroplasma floricola]AUB31612.1 hypothetical protein SFLOR_v1c05600 [Spiroplasma floricola 23-6]